MQQYGLINVWQSGDWVIRFILVFLFSMSIVSWTVTIAKGFSNRRLKRLGLAAQKRFWAARSIDGGIEALGNDANNPYRNLAIAAREASEQKDQPMLQGDRNGSEWVAYCVRNALDEQVAHLQNGLAVLASIGSTSPFVGLFGTVWGIYHALVNISASGMATLDKVAGPVGEALIMTAFGLFVAIPAVLAYNAITRANRVELSELDAFAHDLHAAFSTGSRIAAVSARQGQPEAASRASSLNPAPNHGAA